jgi:hypothetical protein
MAYKKTVNILKGKKMYGTGFGLRNQAKGMYTGGFKRYLFGLKYIFGIEVIVSWGEFSR